jgi:uncharacterized protein
MRKVFADTFYWISFCNQHDRWHKRVRDVLKAIEPVQLVTTEEVLTEVLTFYAGAGSYFRQRSAGLIRGILVSESIDVMPQTHESFMAGLSLYEQRLDKGYSITDCISMVVMRHLDITEVLTHDKHFTQEGFFALLQDLNQ